MTNRQEEFWLKEMQKLEANMLDYFRRNPRDKPDGHWCLSAFKRGWYRAKDAEREKRGKRKARVSQ